jgi:hypothetical protein
MIMPTADRQAGRPAQDHQVGAPTATYGRSDTQPVIMVTTRPAAAVTKITRPVHARPHVAAEAPIG